MRGRGNYEGDESGKREEFRAEVVRGEERGGEEVVKGKSYCLVRGDLERQIVL